SSYEILLIAIMSSSLPFSSRNGLSVSFESSTSKFLNIELSGNNIVYQSISNSVSFFSWHGIQHLQSQTKI
ncbi:5129_t:CDS:1, partial [Funneliformis mosseae]